MANGVFSQKNDCRLPWLPGFFFSIFIFTFLSDYFLVIENRSKWVRALQITIVYPRRSGFASGKSIAWPWPSASGCADARYWRSFIVRAPQRADGQIGLRPTSGKHGRYLKWCPCAGLFGYKLTYKFLALNVTVWFRWRATTLFFLCFFAFF